MTPEKPVDPKRSKLASEIAVRLRELRARHDLTQDEVASRIECHESALSRWESGSRLPSCQDIVQLARVYGVSCDILLGVESFALPKGSAIVDVELLERLNAAPNTGAFDAIVEERKDQAVWMPIEEGVHIFPLSDAVRRAHGVAAKFPDSAHTGMLFRPARSPFGGGAEGPSTGAAAESGSSQSADA